MHSHHRREVQRFRFVRRRDGLPAALAFARQTLSIYRQAISDPNHHAATREFRPGFEVSIRLLEQLVPDATA